jgi:hypothetical protein
MDTTGNMPTKDIRNYLHLYLGCEVIVKAKDNTGPTIKGRLHSLDLKYNDCVVGAFDFSISEANIKPILRPLSDMTEEEAKELYLTDPYAKGSWLIKSVTVEENIKGFEPNIVRIEWEGSVGNLTSSYGCGTEYMYLNKLNAKQHRLLLSKHFDLFDLIPAGLAIDATKEAVK